MLFDSSLRREAWRGFVGTLVVLLTVVLTMILIRMLGLAAKGSVAVADVSLLLGYSLFNQTPVLISLALFAAAVGMLARLQRDSELVVWQASGVKLSRLIKPLWQMAWPILAVLALLVLVVRPWSQHQAQQIKERFEQRSDIARVAPGQFQTSADGRKVFFIDSHSDAQTVGRQVFIVSTAGHVESVITAEEGRVVTRDGLRHLVLQRGERVETNLATGTKSRAKFDQAEVLLGDAPGAITSTDKARNKPTLELMVSSNRTDRAELVWRLGTIWAALNLVLIALASSSDQVRRANSWSMVWALLVFIVYYNLQSLVQSWVASGRMREGVGLFAVHGVVTLLALTWLYWRDGSWRGRWQQRGGRT